MFKTRGSRSHAVLNRQAPGLIFVAVIASAGLAACGGTSSTSSPAAGSASGPSAAAAQAAAPAHAALATDACALVTEQEETAAIGIDPGAGKAQGTSSKSCMSSGPGGLFVGVAFNPHADRSQLDAAKAQLRGSYEQQGGSVQDMSGAGDAGFVASTSHGGACAFVKGTVMAEVTIVSPTPMASLAAAMTTLCRKAAGRI